MNSPPGVPGPTCDIRSFISTVSISTSCAARRRLQVLEYSRCGSRASRRGIYWGKRRGGEAMPEDQRRGTVYWIDHYVVPTADPYRWRDFYGSVMGAEPREDGDRPERPARKAITLFTYVGRCHVGGSCNFEPLTPVAGLPRYSWYIRPED